MQALVLDQPGDVRTIHPANIAQPTPGDGDIRVKVAAIGLNPVDYKLAGRGNPAWSFPHVLGLDVSGTVDATGAGVVQWKTGDRVYYHGNLAKPGGYAEYAVTTAHTVAAIPDSVSFVDAAAVPCAGLTAYQGIVRKLHVSKGQSVWVQGGAGGVGGFGIQLVRALGAMAITTASPGNADYVRALGADHVIDYNSEDVVARIMEITDGRGVDAVQSAVDADTADQGIAVLAFGGAMTCIAGLPAMTEESFSKANSVHRIALGGAHQSNNRAAQDDLGAMAAELIDMVAQGTVQSMVEQTISLEQVPEGLARLEGRHVRGKIVAILSS
jgi:NADPH2:quinone reductase